MVLAVALCVVAAGCTETQSSRAQSSRAQSSRAQTRPTQAPQSEATTREGPTEQAVPARGKPRPPQARLSGRPVWVAPDPAQEPHLRRVSGPLPAAIDLDQAYPELTPGSVERALLAMTVVDDTSAVRRILILDVAGQVYEISSLAQTADVRMPIELSPDGTGLRFGYVDGPVTLELFRPSLLDEGAPPQRVRRALPAWPDFVSAAGEALACSPPRPTPSPGSRTRPACEAWLRIATGPKRWSSTGHVAGSSCWTVSARRTAARSRAGSRPTRSWSRRGR